jgi:hypothetical protein
MSDHQACAYCKADRNITIIVSMYVDDMLIFSNNKSRKEMLRKNLIRRFKMKDHRKQNRTLT